LSLTHHLILGEAMRKKAHMYLAAEKKLLASFHKLTNTLKGKEIKKDSGENLDELYLAVLASQNMDTG
jgi:hypothetical protein